MVVFTEIEQEEIMNEFLNKIYTNDMLNIFDKHVADCYCKLNDEKVELSKLNLSSNIINNICKFNYEECEGCESARRRKMAVKNPERGTAINEYIYLFSRCHSFPDKQDLKVEFKFSFDKIRILRNIYRGIYNNDVNRIAYCCEGTKFNYNNMIRDFNKVVKYIYDNEYCRRCFAHNTKFVECPEFKLLEYRDDDD